MASMVANLPPSPLFVCGRRPLLRTLQKFTVSAIKEKQGCVAVIAKATSESSKSSTSLSIVKSLRVKATERQGRVAVIAKASGESSESSTSLSIVKSVQNVWDKSEDRLALIGLGFAAVVALWASANLITAIDKLPLIPSVLEFVGILFSSWFIYRYLLFKPDREELFQTVNKSISDILGQ